MTMGVAVHFSFSRLLLAGTIGGLALTFASAAICGPSVKGNDRPAFSVGDVQTDQNDKDDDRSKKKYQDRCKVDARRTRERSRGGCTPVNADDQSALSRAPVTDA
jgi:hypothetical protein